MKIECTVEEFKELLKKEQAECKSECSKINVTVGDKKIIEILFNNLANREKFKDSELF